MSDLIDRQAAIDAIKAASKEIQHWLWEAEGCESYCEGVADVETCLDDLPSAQPERKTGEWIIRDIPGTGWFRVICSECGEDVTSIIPLIGFFPDCKALWNYCPNCGADMRGEQDGSD